MTIRRFRQTADFHFLQYRAYQEVGAEAGEGRHQSCLKVGPKHQRRIY